MEPVDLTQHENLGVRSQAQALELIDLARERIMVASRITFGREPSDLTAMVVQAHAQIAQAAATTALALLTLNAGSDIELVITKLRDTIDQVAP